MEMLHGTNNSVIMLIFLLLAVIYRIPISQKYKFHSLRFVNLDISLF